MGKYSYKATDWQWWKMSVGLHQYCHMEGVFINPYICDISLKFTGSQTVYLVLVVCLLITLESGRNGTVISGNWEIVVH